MIGTRNHTNRAALAAVVVLVWLGASGVASAGSKILGNSCDYDWWYGCSPTSAGMIMGHYDRNGYGGGTYNALITGGVAESDTFPAGTYIANTNIASSGQIADYWGDPDPLGSGRTLPDDWDSIADYMRTSQGDRDNGGTSFYYWGSGNKYYWSGADAEDGMRGLVTYIQYRGYDVDGNTGAFTQLTDNEDPDGFTFAEFKAEIDADRPVILHVTGHSMFGYGYDDTGSTVYLHDTWNAGQKSMTWGGSYSTLDMWGVSVFHLDTGTADLDGVAGGSAHVEFDDGGFSGDTSGLPAGSTALPDAWGVHEFDDGGDGWATLKFHYADADVPAGYSETDLRAYWWDTDEWSFDGVGTFYSGAPQGGLGDYGVDTIGNLVWINVNHGSEWAVAAVPEPASLSLMALGALLLIRRRRRAA